MRARKARCFHVPRFAILCGTACVLVLVHPQKRLIVSAAAFVFDWNSSIGVALLWVSVVKIAKEYVELIVKDVLLGKHVIDESFVAFEKFTWARSSCV